MNKAHNLFINTSERNHLLAQYYAGLCYQFGYGTTKNDHLAFKYYEKVAKEDCAIGQLQIGYCYDKGVGTESNLKMAASYYET